MTVYCTTWCKNAPIYTCILYITVLKTFGLKPFIPEKSVTFADNLWNFSISLSRSTPSSSAISNIDVLFWRTNGTVLQTLSRCHFGERLSIGKYRIWLHRKTEDLMSFEGAWFKTRELAFENAEIPSFSSSFSTTSGLSYKKQEQKYKSIYCKKSIYQEKMKSLKPIVTNYNFSGATLATNVLRFTFHSLRKIGNINFK